MKLSTIILVIALIACAFGTGAILGSHHTASEVQKGQLVKEDLLCMTVEFLFQKGLQADYYTALKAFADERGLPQPPPPTNWFNEYTTSVDAK